MGHPEGQVIIAYSGTTGGTNLLANPVIAVTQIIADLQVIATRHPWHFHDAAGLRRRGPRRGAPTRA
ncbi:hypothetical protein [Mycolicibacterium insubricum]|uniref:hypothetical protein n=1 Tax=Mycolicibacterium insubricum TaxID=444597 RepID=UPI0027E257CE|nr:hypothetical protein [Mycolicibacterium insubricum]MCV7080821.1 hypothetical protein [Mycolicibacterium insubricum]